MDHILSVQVIDGFKHLMDGLRGILLCEFALLANAIEQFSAGSKLGNNVPLVLSICSAKTFEAYTPEFSPLTRTTHET